MWRFVCNATEHNCNPTPTPTPHPNPNPNQVLKEVYVLYSDFVLKNPFYENDMPIHCDKFDQKLMKLAEDYNRRG